MTGLVHRLRNRLELDREDIDAAARSIEQLNAALTEWIDKTNWVQETCTYKELGLHRADVLKQRIEQLERENAELRIEVGNLRNTLASFIDPQLQTSDERRETGM